MDSCIDNLGNCYVYFASLITFSYFSVVYSRKFSILFQVPYIQASCCMCIDTDLVVLYRPVAHSAGLHYVLQWVSSCFPFFVSFFFFLPKSFSQHSLKLLDQFSRLVNLSQKVLCRFSQAWRYMKDNDMYMAMFKGSVNVAHYPWGTMLITCILVYLSVPLRVHFLDMFSNFSCSNFFLHWMPHGLHCFYRRSCSWLHVLHILSDQWLLQIFVSNACTCISLMPSVY